MVPTCKQSEDPRLVVLTLLRLAALCILFRLFFTLARLVFTLSRLLFVLLRFMLSRLDATFRGDGFSGEELKLLVGDGLRIVVCYGEYNIVLNYKQPHTK